MIKNAHTQHQRLSLGEALSVLANMFANWSINRDRDDHKFEQSVEVSEENWRDASNYVKLGYLVQIAKSDKFLVCDPND